MAPRPANQPDYERYRTSPAEKARTEDLLRLLPRNRRSVLDIGARDGFFSKLLTQYFGEVTALDLTKPAFDIPGVTAVAGDVTRLDYPDASFDCVFCAEVLEHIPALEQACRELARVARHELIIGVPYRQDTRVGRTVCQSCKRHNPPNGHVNEFDLPRLKSLFPGLRVAEQSFVGLNGEVTNALSAWLMDLGGNPWGSYDQEEPCIHCGADLTPPPSAALWQRVCSASAVRLNRLQQRFTQPHGNWIHLVLTK